MSGGGRYDEAVAALCALVDDGCPAGDEGRMTRRVRVMDCWAHLSRGGDVVYLQLAGPERQLMMFESHLGMLRQYPVYGRAEGHLVLRVAAAGALAAGGAA